MSRFFSEKFELLLKPTKTRRYVAILLYMGYLGLSAYIEYTFLDVTRPIRDQYPQTIFYTRWLTSCALFLRILAAAVCYGGFFHARITPWTFGSTFSTIATIFMTIASVDALKYAKSDLYSSLSLIFTYEILCYAAGMMIIVIVSYYTLTQLQSSSAKLDIEDPQKLFAKRLLESVVRVLPGLGFASKQIMRMTKAD